MCMLVYTCCYVGAPESMCIPAPLKSMAQFTSGLVHVPPCRLSKVFRLLFFPVVAGRT